MTETKRYTDITAYLQIRAKRHGRTLNLMKTFWDHYYTLPSCKMFKGVEYNNLMRNKYRSCFRKVLKEYIGIDRMQKCSLDRLEAKIRAMQSEAL